MKEELSYMIVTPYTIAKSRTGGVIARLLARVDLELVGTQMIAATAELAKAYAESVEVQVRDENPVAAQLLKDYIVENFSPSGGRCHRVLLLLLRGENACVKLSDVAGSLFQRGRTLESLTGETIRDTYADFILAGDGSGEMKYFEPAVLTPYKQQYARENMRIFLDYMKDQPTIVENLVYPEPSEIERTLVIIKPDNWKYASTRPGSIIDMFSRTGLRIISCKVHRMSIEEAMEFYGPVRDVLKKKLAPRMGRKAKAVLEREFNLKLSESIDDALEASFGVEYAVDQFEQIVEFMSGTRPSACPIEELSNPGKVKCMILLYEGIDAVRKIRDVLGPTDPTDAPGGTVRREFGSDIMVNTAHASDSAESAEREMRIVKIGESGCVHLMENYLEMLKSQPQ